MKRPEGFLAILKGIETGSISPGCGRDGGFNPMCESCVDSLIEERDALARFASILMDENDNRELPPGPGYYESIWSDAVLGD